MYAQRASLIAFFVIALWSRATAAGQLDLKLGQVRTLADGLIALLGDAASK